MRDLELLKNINNDSGIKLLDYQEDHANNLINILNKNTTALDLSDPGIGKTYIASYVCKQMGLSPIIICPKSVISKWKQILTEFGVEYLAVVNYELIVRCKTYYKNAKIKSNFLEYIDKKYRWNVNKNNIFIFDEAHKCKFESTMNAKLLVSAKETGNNILLLSATLVEVPSQFSIFAYVLNFSDSLHKIQKWISQMQNPAKTLHVLLFDKNYPKASRLSIEELGDKFPQTQITAETYTMKNSEDITNEYSKIAEKIKKYKSDGEQSKFILVKLQSEFRKIELYKIPTFIELAKDFLDNNYSVVIFVNYTDTLKMLLTKLKELNYGEVTTINGEQSQKEKDENVNNFQSDKSRIMVANIEAGGVGISLHDINGKHPRVSLISPTFSATNLIQALGRVHRSGGKTKSLQRIIFADNTPETKISKMLFKKLSNLSLLNDGEMETYYIDGLIEEDILNKNNFDGSSKDLQLIIDEDKNYVKKKHVSKVKYIRELFPKMIDMISGVSTFVLLVGKKIFKNKNLLLLGELHERNINCNSCKNNCIEAEYIVPYLSHCLSPNKLDFYLEVDHVYIKNLYVGDNDTASRIGKIYEKYQYLTLKKTQHTENIRIHLADARTNERVSNIDENSIELEKDKFFYSFMFDFWDKILRMVHKNDMDDNDINFAHILLTDLGDIITEKYYENIKEILSGKSTVLNNAMKITKQKNKMIESYKKINNFTEKLDRIIDDVYFKNTSDVFNMMLEIKNMIDRAKNKYPDNRKRFVMKFFKIFRETYHDDPSEKTLKNLFHNFSLSFASYMDRYTIYRMFRKFDGKKQNNVLFYGGEGHTKSIATVLYKTGYFDIEVEKISNYNDCIKL